MEAQACDSCGKPVRADFAFCPWCRRVLHRVCLKCGAVSAQEWKFCPRCGAELEQAAVAAPSRGVRVPEEEPVSDAERFNKAGSDLYDREEYGDAIVQFLKAVDLEPDNPLYEGNLAVAYHDAGMPEQAMDHYKRAVMLDARDTTCRLNMGHLYASMEDKDNARDCYNQVIALAPESEDAEEARQALADLDRL
jgi:Flp pilus assembly protein TadD